MAFHLPYCEHAHINYFFCEVTAVLELACAGASAAQAVVMVVGVLVLLAPLAFILASYVLIVWMVIYIRSSQGCRWAFSTCLPPHCGDHLLWGCHLYLHEALPQPLAYPGQSCVHLLHSSHPALNPLIYSLRNKEVKGALARAAQRGSTSCL